MCFSVNSLVDVHLMFNNCKRAREENIRHGQRGKGEQGVRERWGRRIGYRQVSK